ACRPAASSRSSAATLAGATARLRGDIGCASRSKMPRPRSSPWERSCPRRSPPGKSFARTFRALAFLPSPHPTSSTAAGPPRKQRDGAVSASRATPSNCSCACRAMRASSPWPTPRPRRCHGSAECSASASLLWGSRSSARPETSPISTPAIGSMATRSPKPSRRFSLAHDSIVAVELPIDERNQSVDPLLHPFDHTKVELVMFCKAWQFVDRSPAFCPCTRDCLCPRGGDGGHILAIAINALDRDSFRRGQQPCGPAFESILPGPIESRQGKVGERLIMLGQHAPQRHRPDEAHPAGILQFQVRDVVDRRERSPTDRCKRAGHVPWIANQRGGIRGEPIEQRDSFEPPIDHGGKSICLVAFHLQILFQSD